MVGSDQNVTGCLLTPFLNDICYDFRAYVLISQHNAKLAGLRTAQVYLQAVSGDHFCPEGLCP